MPDHKGGSGYEEKSLDELHKMARDAGIPGHSGMKKDELVKALESHGKDRGGRGGGGR